MPKLRQLRDDEVVYIAIRNPNLMNVETGAIKRNAFFLRLADTDGELNGLSVTVLNHCPTIEEIKNITWLKSKVCGVDVLSVGKIRQIGLDVN